ncbi:MAG: hypothetical protein LBF63_04440 [Treponema sp.]|jgi:hypothetical protein|nr:hypothetical protein [Treponema sp.]
MRNLLDFIFENLIPIIIVTSVIIRIFVGIKNSARRQSAAPVPKTNADDGMDVWSRLKPDDDDDGGRAKPEPYRAPAEYSRPLLTPDPLHEAPPPAAVTRPPAVERESPAAPGPGPLDRLDKLPPLRRAVILAEILGPPKGLD